MLDCGTMRKGLCCATPVEIEGDIGTGDTRDVCCCGGVKGCIVELRKGLCVDCVAGVPIVTVSLSKLAKSQSIPLAVAVIVVVVVVLALTLLHLMMMVVVGQLIDCDVAQVDLH